MAGLAPERISRFLTYLLRHRPKEYPLLFDKRGFVDWDDVVEIVQERYYDVTEAQISDVVTESEKQRFELIDGKVRATYGHSFPVDFAGCASEPPARLYFGAARDLAQSILSNGLNPRDRQYVHLSLTAAEAESVARRQDPAAVLLIIDAQAAHNEGVEFYRSGPLFLAASIPSKFLSLG
jgi:putative RNA 2'-phosphotransferase